MTRAIEPVQVAIEVRRGIEEAFRVFTDEIAAWWPVAGHSVEPDRVAAVVLEGRLGGRLYERERVMIREARARFPKAWKKATRHPP